MSTPYPYPYSPNGGDDGASQRSSSTSNSPQPSWSPTPGLPSRTYFDPQPLRYHPSKSVSKTYPATQRSNYPPQSSPVTAAQPRPHPSPAYSDSFYQSSLADAGAGFQQDSRFNFGTPNIVSGNLLVPPPSPSPSQYQQQQDADRSTQRGLSRSVGQFFKDTTSPKPREFCVDGFEAGSPSLPSGGEPGSDERGRGMIPRPAQLPNLGSSSWGGPVEEESKGQSPPHAAYDQWGAQTNAQSFSGGNGSEFYYEETQRGY